MIFKGISCFRSANSLLFSSKSSSFKKIVPIQFLRFFSDSDLDDSFYQDLPTVYTTAICCKDKTGRTHARIGTYWGKNDELNTYKPFNTGIVTIARAQLESVSFALRQAVYDKKVSGVVVKTDSKYVSNVANRFMQNWRTNNFHKIDGTPVKNREDIEELDRLLQSVQADIQYVEFAKDGQNILLKYLTDEGIMNEDLNDLQSHTFDGPQELSNFELDENSKEPIPIVFVSGSHTKSGHNGFYVAGYGVHWANNEFRDQSGRFSDLPVTLYRSQLTSIALALEEAVNAGLMRVEIATDCGMFLTHFKAKWKKANGLPIANYPLYKKILSLTDRIQVKFTYIPESLNNLEMEKSKQLAIDGMAYPIVRKKNFLGMGRVCPQCNSSEIDEDSARGDATCMNCGTVLEESVIVSDVQFQERGGGHEIVGQFVGRDRGQPTSLMGVPGLPRTESRELTYYKGKKLIQEIASQLRINQHCIDIAFNFFKMCVSRNFTRGRGRSQVVVACLYMTCRLENTSHLLLDFSDVTQINVFDLGKTLNFLTRSLKINLPTTDPCLYVLRFSAMLDLGDKQKDIVSLATRIVQRMKRDWMSTGRRPTGLCGAALLLAAKAFNLNRTIADVVRIVHISESVVRKRLDEFSSTPSASLTIDEFSTVDLEDSEDPPSFQESKKKARECQRRKEEDNAENASKNLMVVQKEIEVALKRKFKKSPYAKLIVDPESTADVKVPELEEAEVIVRNELIDTVYDVVEEDDCEPSTKAVKFGPSLSSLGILTPTSGSFGDQKPHHSDHADDYIDDGELDLSGIDDSEIDTYILNEVESTIKTKVWLARNGEHLEEMDRRRKLREEEEEKNKDNPKKKRKIVRRKEPINAVSHNDAIYQVIQEKNLSSKINYDILRRIEGADSILDGNPEIT